MSFNKDQAVELTGATVQQVAISPSGTDSDQAFPLTASEDSWAERFSAGADWDDTVDAPWPIAPTTGTIDLVSVATDMGGQFSGEFTFGYTSTKIGSGTATLTPWLGYSLDNVTYNWIDASSAVTLTARYVKAKFVWTCAVADTFYIVSEPVSVNIKAMPVVEFGEIAITGSGNVSITFNMTFAAVDKITLTPEFVTTTPALRNIVADNVSLAGMDIYSFDAAGAAAACDLVKYKIEGV